MRSSVGLSMVMLIMVFIVMMRVMLYFTPFFFAVEYQEIHAEAIKRGDKHPCQYRKVGKTTAGDVENFAASIMLSLE